MAAGDVDRAVGDEKHSTLVPANNVLGPPKRLLNEGSGYGVTAMRAIAVHSLQIPIRGAVGRRNTICMHDGGWSGQRPVTMACSRVFSCSPWFPWG